MSYKDIIQEIREGKGAEALYNIYANKFYGYAIDKWHFREDEALDVVDKTLSKLLEKIPQCDFEAQKQFNAYVWTVFRSYLGKGYRKKNRKSNKIQFVSIEQSTEGIIKDENLKSAGFDDDFIHSFLGKEKGESERMKLFKQALSQLDEIEREILLLRADNLTYLEIGDILNIDRKQLKVKHFRAKENLIKLFKEIQKSIVQL